MYPNYIYIGTIEIDTYINTRCAHADAIITSDKYIPNIGFDGVRAATYFVGLGDL